MDLLGDASVLGLTRGPGCPGCGRSLVSPADGFQDHCPGCGFLMAGSQVFDEPIDRAPTQAGHSSPARADWAKILSDPEFSSRYTEIEKLDEGGMGAVFAARQVDLSRDVVLKVILSAGSTDRARFEREGRVMARLQHPNVLQIFGVEWVGSHPVLVLERVEGWSLQQEIRRLGRLDLDRSISYVSDILRGLVAAHAAGIIHRDLKAGNVLISRDGSIKVIDFGLAIETGVDSRLTEAGVILGTPAYMSPEQARGASGSERSDLYSVGVILYEMLSGQLPHTGPTALDVIQSMLTRPTPRIETLVPSIPVEVARTIHKALEKDPESRFSSAALMLESILARGHRLESTKESIPAEGLGLPLSASAPGTTERIVAPVAATGRDSLVLARSFFWPLILATVVVAIALQLSFPGAPQLPGRVDQVSSPVLIDSMKFDRFLGSRARMDIDPVPRSVSGMVCRIRSSAGKITDRPLSLDSDGTMILEGLQPGSVNAVEILRDGQVVPGGVSNLDQPRSLRLMEQEGNIVIPGNDYLYVAFKCHEPHSFELTLRRGDREISQLITGLTHAVVRTFEGLLPSTDYMLNIRTLDERLVLLEGNRGRIPFRTRDAGYPEFIATRMSNIDVPIASIKAMIELQRYRPVHARDRFMQELLDPKATTDDKSLFSRMLALVIDESCVAPLLQAHENATDPYDRSVFVYGLSFLADANLFEQASQDLLALGQKYGDFVGEDFGSFVPTRAASMLWNLDSRQALTFAQRIAREVETHPRWTQELAMNILWHDEQEASCIAVKELLEGSRSPLVREMCASLIIRYQSPSSVSWIDHWLRKRPEVVAGFEADFIAGMTYVPGSFDTSLRLGREFLASPDVDSQCLGAMALALTGDVSEGIRLLEESSGLLDPEVAASLVWGLGQSDSTQARDLIDRLNLAGRGYDGQLVLALVRQKGQASIPSLRQWIQRAGNGGRSTKLERAHALLEFGRLGGDSAFPDLSAASMSGSLYERGMALLGLAYLADPRVNEFLEATAVSDQLYDLRLESLLGRILRGGELGGFLREVMSKSDDGLAKIAKNYYPITHLEFRNGQSFDLDGFLPWVKAPLEMILGDSYFGLALGFWCPGGDPDDARALACSTEKSWIGNDAALMFFVGHDYPRFDLGRTTPEYRMGEGQLLVRIPRVRGSRSVGFGMAYLVAEPLK